MNRIQRVLRFLQSILNNSSTDKLNDAELEKIFKSLDVLKQDKIYVELFSNPLSVYHDDKCIYAGRDGITANNVMTLFCMNMFGDMKIKAQFSGLDGLTACNLANSLHDDIVSDFEKRTLTTMYNLLCIKFRNPDLKAILLATGTKYIQVIAGGSRSEYWASSTRLNPNTNQFEGANNLGKLLMLIRHKIQTQA